MKLFLTILIFTQPLFARSIYLDRIQGKDIFPCVSRTYEGACDRREIWAINVPVDSKTIESNFSKLKDHVEDLISDVENLKKENQELKRKIDELSRRR